MQSTYINEQTHRRRCVCSFIFSFFHIYILYKIYLYHINEIYIIHMNNTSLHLSLFFIETNVVCTALTNIVKNPYSRFRSREIPPRFSPLIRLHYMQFSVVSDTKFRVCAHFPRRVDLRVDFNRYWVYISEGEFY